MWSVSHQDFYGKWERSHVSLYQYLCFMISNHIDVIYTNTLTFHVFMNDCYLSTLLTNHIKLFTKLPCAFSFFSRTLSHAQFGSSVEFNEMWVSEIVELTEQDCEIKRFPLKQHHISHAFNFSTIPLWISIFRSLWTWAEK